MSKNVICLDAKRAPKRDASGKPTTGKYIGVFSQKVAEGTPGAFHYSGVIAATQKPYSYYAKESTIVRGFLRWVDVVDGKYDPNIFIYLESEKFLYRISLAYDAANLRQVANYLAGAAKAGILETNFFNLTYDVWAKKDKTGAPVIGENGAQLWASALKFGDVVPLVDPSAMFGFQREHGLEWSENFNATKNKRTKDPSNEMRYWMTVILKLQRLLMKGENYLPFTYNSICFQPAPHPLGFGGMTEQEREKAAARYAQIRGAYIMPFGRQVVDADDVYGDAPANGWLTSKQQPERTEPQDDFFNSGFPDAEAMAVPAKPAPFFEPEQNTADDLPF